MNDSKKALRALVLANALAFFLIPRPALFGAQTDAPLAQSLDAARRTRDESQLRSIKTQIEQRLRQNSEDALTQYHLAQVQGYLADVYEGRKDNRSASKAIDEATRSGWSPTPPGSPGRATPPSPWGWGRRRWRR